MNDGWARAGAKNSWFSSVRRHYFRNGLSLCGKYTLKDLWGDLEGNDPKERKPAIDCVLCSRILDKEIKKGPLGG